MKTSFKVLSECIGDYADQRSSQSWLINLKMMKSILESTRSRSRDLDLDLDIDLDLGLESRSISTRKS